jgi:hypothetical protein
MCHQALVQPWHSFSNDDDADTDDDACNCDSSHRASPPFWAQFARAASLRAV